MKKVLVSIVIGMVFVFVAIITISKYVDIKNNAPENIVENKNIATDIQKKEEILKNQKNKIEELEKEKKKNVASINKIQKDIKENNKEISQQNKKIEESKNEKINTKGAIENLQENMLNVADFMIIPIMLFFVMYLLIRRTF